MVQLGNFHIGAAETSKEPALSAGEAHLLWSHLVSRYDCVEKTQIYEHLAHDQEFKMMIAKELKGSLEKQIIEIEKIMDKYKLPLPCRPPKSVNIDSSSQILNDRFIFRDILSGCENYLETNLHAIRTFITSDPLRKMFNGYLIRELEVYDDLCKYGKVKGWFEIPPLQ